MKKSSKKKNPLYVVRGKDVLEASSLLDLVIKKFNLLPALNLLKTIFNLLLSQVQSYAMFEAVKKFFDDLFASLAELGLTHFKSTGK